MILLPSSLGNQQQNRRLTSPYIELNPVRAEMVNRPHDYRWSSYHANGLGKADRLITPQSDEWMEAT